MLERSIPSRFSGWTAFVACITRRARAVRIPRSYCPVLSEWRFEAEFSDGSTKWMLWPEANKMAALDEYSMQPTECELKLPQGKIFFRRTLFPLHAAESTTEREDSGTLMTQF